MIGKYCVTRQKTDFADYVSCNGATDEQTCLCAVYVDRCYARRSVDSCLLYPWQARDHATTCTRHVTTHVTIFRSHVDLPALAVVSLWRRAGIGVAAP